MCFRYTETRESDYLMHEKGFLSRSATYFDETAQKTLGIFPLPPKEFDRNLYVLTRYSTFFLEENPIFFSRGKSHLRCTYLYCHPLGNRTLDFPKWAPIERLITSNQSLTWPQSETMARSESLEESFNGFFCRRCLTHGASLSATCYEQRPFLLAPNAL